MLPRPALARPVLLVCAVALLIGVPAVLAASGGGSAAAGTRFYACVVGESRTLNLVTKNARCPRHATKISWSASGAAGPRGLPGATGDAGAAGAGGPAGPVGAAGAAGNQGAAGVVGSPGTPGPKGDTGTPGAKGDAGNPGAKGDTGETGPAGGTMLIGGGPVTISSALGGLPLATTLLPVSGRLGSGNTTSYPPSSIDPAVMAAAQVMSTDITITGFRFVYTNTVTAFTLNTPVISVTLYAGQPGGALSSTSVGCWMTGTSPMPIGVALTCHGDASLVVSAGTMLYLGVVSTTNESTTLSGQVATGLTTN